ncbi:hypothetical protein [Rhizobium chutanense]|uniref:TIGR04255 family protein n=1 Tax=Rhizobium chutanense TaxID=2035448 RepID=A0A3S0S641_9HYPH|nr:hypothetical protein [Rhizobium chutanense]RUM00193.1 hypothetical protein EFR84_25330 [Rhizobium chutanense]
MPWTPANPDHAIDRAHIKFEFEPLPAKAHHRASEIVRAAAESIGMSDIVSIQTPQVHILATPDGGTQLVPEQTSGAAKSFRKVSEDGNVEYAAICAPDHLAFDVRSYDSWAQIFPRIKTCLQDAVRFVHEDVSSVQSVRFEYWDRFVRREPDGSDFLSKNSVLIPPLFAGLNGSWHSHVGFFKNSGNKRMLLNANVDIMSVSDFVNDDAAPLIPPGVESLCRIYTLCLVTAHPSQYFAEVDDCIAAADLAHNELKAMLGNIINGQLASEIKLSAESFVR